jgi:APA family basic amino acid/polyamine antiporter
VILAVVQVGSLFSADAWNNITFTAGEVKNPKRNIPLSLILGTGFVLTVYFLVSLGYLLVLPMHGDPNGATVMARGIQYATEDRVATAALEQIFHSGGAYLMAAAILISTFGCANGMTLAGARVYYAMSQDGLFFKSVGKLHPRYKTPAAGLLVQAAWTTCCASPAPMASCWTTSSSRCWCFTFSPSWGCLCCASSGRRAAALQGAGLSGAAGALHRDGGWICVVLLRYKPQYTWPGLVLVLLGIPVYLFWSRRTASNGSKVPSQAEVN